jgi:uncharacterized Zn finger protein
MEIITDKNAGLFPAPKEIEFGCSCPDIAYMCKHIAAVLYGVGARLDTRPEDLFLLRQVDHMELVASVYTSDLVRSSQEAALNSNLSSLFGIDIEEDKKSNKKVKISTSTMKAQTKKTSSKSAAAKRKPKTAAVPIKTKTTAKKTKKTTVKKRVKTG